MTKKAIITIGVSCSGKTTWSQEFIQNNPRWEIVCRDDIREKILFSVKKQHPFTWDKWNWRWEQKVTDEQQRLFEVYASLDLLEGIIVADTHLNDRTLYDVKNRLTALGYEIEEKIFHVNWNDAVKRDTKRVNGVGVSVLAKQFKQYYSKFSRQYIPQTHFQKTIIVDLDGTLAQKVTNRSWYEWDRVGEDAVNKPLRDMISGLPELGWTILIVSGRDEVCRKETEDWLGEHSIPFKKLIMRNNNDHRDDAIVKEELFWEQIANYYNVQLIIDDRPKTCRMWRRLNIPILQAGNPYIEF